MSKTMWYTSPRFTIVKRRISSAKSSTLFLPDREKGYLLLKSKSSLESFRLPASDIREDAPIVLEYSLTLHSIENLDMLLSFGLDAILSLSGAASGSLFLWDEQQKEFTLKVWRHTKRLRPEEARVKLGEAILGRVGKLGESFLVKDIRYDTRFVNTTAYGRYQSHSFISVPLIADDKLVGVVNVTEKDDFSQFDEEDLWLVEIVSRHVAIAYENRRYSFRLRREVEELHQKLFESHQILKNQEAFVAVGKLMAHLSHELNNPLDAIRRYVNLALDIVLDNSLAREHLLKAKAGIRRAIQVIRGLLEFSRQTRRITSKRTELHAILEEGIQNLQNDSLFSKIEIRKEFCGVPSYIKDCGLSVVLSNLYQNANQAMGGIGPLTVRTLRKGNQIRLSVEDSGSGISEDIKTKIFEPFFTTKKNGEGMGIGLSLCREIVERCGGRISCESMPDQGRGACFIIDLKCEETAQ